MNAQKDNPSLTHRAARGAMLGSIAAVIDRLNALAVQATLTYILLKAEFGIWSLASPFMALATILVQTALRDLLIHRAPKFRIWSNPAAWLSMVLGLSAGASVIIIGYFASILYNSPELTLVLLIASLQPIASGITTVPRAKLSIDMRFGTLAAYFCATSISNWILALIFALLGAGVYAFPLGIAITAIGQMIAIWFIAPVRLRPTPQIRRWIYIIKDTGTILASNFAKWARTQGDRLILGVFLSQSMMGIYFLAFQLSIQTFSVLTLNLSSVLLPALASLNNEPERQINAFIRSLKMLIFLAAPICAGTIVVATPVTNIIFDESKWQHLDTTLQLITAGMIFRAIEPPVKSLMNAQGRFYELFVLNLVSTISFALFIAAVLYSVGFIETETNHLFAAAIAGGVFHAALAAVLVHYAIKGSGRSTTKTIAILSEPASYAVFTALAAWAINQLYPSQTQAVSQTVIDLGKVTTAVLVFFLVYVVIARTRKPREFVTLLTFAINATPSRFKPIITRIAHVCFACSPSPDH